MTTPDVPGYRIIRELGRGGMATVYLAIQDKFDREVAIKIMDPELLHDETFSRRFQRESRIVGGLSHPHIIQVYDVGLAGTNHYLSMECIGGGELNDRLETGIETRTAFRVIKEIAKALDFAHSKGFIHRDIKPENILFREEGSVVLSDFGIARGMENETQITTLGSVVGTPYYMSPEQVTGEKLDGRSDLYSLGVVFYKTLTGKVPYDGDSALNIGIRHIKDPVPRLPAGLAQMQPLIDKFMAKSPANRYQTGAEVVEAFEKFEGSNAMPQSVAKTEIISSDIVDQIKKRTGQAVASAGKGDRPSVTRVMRVKPRRKSPLRFVAIGITMALIIAVAGWYVLQQQGFSLGATAPESAPALADDAAPPAPLPAAVDDPRTQSLADLIGEADALMARGLLLEPAAGNALDMYRQALAKDPDNRAALTGIDAVGRQVAEDGIAHVEAGRIDAARESLDVSRSLAPDAQAVLSLAEALDRLDAASTLLDRAQSRIDSGHLTQPPDDSAVALVRAALRLQPRPEGAEALRDELVARLEGIAAEAREFEMARRAQPYSNAAAELVALQ